MSIAQTLLPEFDQEMSNTRRVLERVPEDRFDWQPHPKSMKLGRLATHLAEIPSWGIRTLHDDSIDIAPVGGTPYQPPTVTTRVEVLELFDRNTKAMREALADTEDAAFMTPWSLLRGGATIFTMPRVAVVRAMLLNHNIHHRAQLGVYLRLNDVPVPAIYGPSADES